MAAIAQGEEGDDVQRHPLLELVVSYRYGIQPCRARAFLSTDLPAEVSREMDAEWRAFLRARACVSRLSDDTARLAEVLIKGI